MSQDFFDHSMQLELLAPDEACAEQARRLVARGGFTCQATLNRAIQALRADMDCSWEEIDEFAALIAELFEVVTPDTGTYDNARLLARQHGLDLDDALALACAQQAGCARLHSLHLPADLRLEGGLSVNNPQPRKRPAAGRSGDTRRKRITNLYARPGFLLRRAHQISVAIFESACADIELTPAQFSVLTALYARPGYDQTSLARALGMDKVTISHLLRGLEARGLVLRAATEQSRRGLAISLTDAGSALRDQAEPRVERAYRQLLAPLGRSQQKQLLGLLHTLNTRLEPLARTTFKPIPE
ncbi:MarR family transcriptional regulator [Azoarcus indigens]|uniref:DNA-binding MarR family transcriptional regulator n=1 Tax=Azoarcus indigens TaxID=29545 RepID=A0A4R6DWM7_9RHOO|nr:MarR family transcriptional regulator [Azoarcus indigens]NMG67655.1 MarR family transcriptional regulator [Azoarcus indigens]TDN49661.1 DNA-binding MarR family transcriptional regulator [Azoarcus indigens]